MRPCVPVWPWPVCSGALISNNNSLSWLPMCKQHSFILTWQPCHSRSVSFSLICLHLSFVCSHAFSVRVRFVKMFSNSAFEPSFRHLRLHICPHYSPLLLCIIWLSRSLSYIISFINGSAFPPLSCMTFSPFLSTCAQICCYCEFLFVAAVVFISFCVSYSL